MQDVNWQRKQAQTQAGEKLRALEAHWVLLVSKNYEIETECVELEKVVQAAREQLEKLAPPNNDQTPPTEQTNGHEPKAESSGDDDSNDDAEVEEEPDEAINET